MINLNVKIVPQMVYSFSKFNCFLSTLAFLRNTVAADFTNIVSAPKQLKQLQFNLEESAFLLNKTLDNSSENNVAVRVALIERPLYAESCAFDNPPCAGCQWNEICGGFDYKFTMYSLGQIFGHQPKIFRANGVSPSDTGATVIGMLNQSKIDISCQYITLDYGRNKFAKSAFPLFFSEYVAVVKFPTGSHAAIVENVSVGAAIFLLLFILVYLTNKTLYKLAEELPLTTASDYITQMSMAFFWLVVAVVLAYIGSAVTLILYRPSMPSTPFNTFGQLAKGMSKFRYNVFTPFNITVEKLFKQKDAGGVLKELYDAALVNPPKVLPLFETIDKVRESYRNVAILTDYADRRIVNQKYCLEVMEIPPIVGELPIEMHGCYARSGFRHKFDWYKRHVLTNSYYAWLNYYTWNKTSECGLSGSAAADLMARRSQSALTFGQLKLFFFFLAIGGGIGFLIFVMEHLHFCKSRSVKVGEGERDVFHPLSGRTI